jgi:hypothetical protein
MTEVARRLQRVEVLFDERIVTRDMLTATERLFEARELTHAAEVQNLQNRVGKLEGTNSKLLIGIVMAFIGLLISVLAQVLEASGGST